MIWLDLVQFTRGGYTNRNRMPDGSWLTVPLKHPVMVPLNELEIDSSTGWQSRHCKTLTQHYGEIAKPFCMAINAGHHFLVTLNMHLLALLLLHSTTIPYLQSEFDFVPKPTISEQLAAMVYAVDGDVYVSGPSGHKYLDETPFHERGLIVRYAEPRAVNPCVLSRYLEPAA